MTTDAVTLTANNGRDAGKTFQIAEVPPVDMAAFILRLLAAIQLGGVDELLELMRGGTGADGESRDQITAVLRLLAGCDPAACKALIVDALTYVQIAPDPASPGMFRKLRDDDIKEMATLGDVLGAFVRTNVMPA